MNENEDEAREEYIRRKVMDIIAERIDTDFYPQVSKDIKELTALWRRGDP